MHIKDTHKNNRTNDIGLASFLLVKGHDLQTISKDKFTAKATFIFKDSVGVQRDIAGYWSKKQFKLSPMMLFTELKNLKARIYNS